MIDTKQMAKYIFEEYANCYSKVDIEELAKHLDEIRAEAVKEFAEKLKLQAYTECSITGYKYQVVQIEEIDNLVKEFTEGKND